EHGIQLKYFQSWRCKEIAKEQLQEQLVRDSKEKFSHEMKRLMVDDFYAAAYAPRPVGFQRCVKSIKSISLEAYNWIMQSEPVHWANAFFQGARYNHMTSNFGELFYNLALDAHELPITLMVATDLTSMVRPVKLSILTTGIVVAKGGSLLVCRAPMPLPSSICIDRPMHKGSSKSEATVTPPPTRRPPGQPTIKRLGSQGAMQPIKEYLGFSNFKFMVSSTSINLGSIAIKAVLVVEELVQILVDGYGRNEIFEVPNS
ncbi:hypothetical protein U1Q18_002744, partial [Sarracenia purpurea var. burkii]